ncbi:MAG: AI-2E family transporter, partial [Candidatus Moranbacteria bacterium]|nr:AI-2E family transporter [Candidatus Moranbacteria bacterium]
MNKENKQKNNKNQEITVHISYTTLLRTALIVLVIFFVYHIFDIIITLFISFIIVSTISPLVDKLEDKKIPRIISTILIYILFFFGFGYILSLLIPIFIRQIDQFINRVPEYAETFSSSPFLKNFINKENFQNLDYQRIITQNTATLGGYIKNEAERLIYIAVMFSLSFYMTIQKNAVKRLSQILSPKPYEKYITSLVLRIQNKMGKWLLGQLALNLIIGSAVYVILYFLQVPYALILAIIA